MISNKDKKRFYKFFQKYLKNNVSLYKNAIPKKWITNFLKYGDKGSIFLNDREAKLLNLTKKQVLFLKKKVNITNHFLNTFYFAQEIIKNYDTTLYENKELGIKVALFSVSVTLFAQANARMLTGRIETAEELIKRGKIIPTPFLNNRLAKFAAFAIKKPYPPAVKAFEKGKFNANEGTNISLVIFLANQQARYRELRFFFSS